MEEVVDDEVWNWKEPNMVLVIRYVWYLQIEVTHFVMM